MFNKIILLLLVVIMLIILCDNKKSENFAAVSPHHNLLGKPIYFKFNPNADGRARTDICADFAYNQEMIGELRGTVFAIEDNRIIPRWDVLINNKGNQRCTPLDNGMNFWLRSSSVNANNHNWLRLYTGSYPGEVPSYFAGLIPSSFAVPKEFNKYVDIKVNGYSAKYKINK